jgi:hypothetical protein
LDQKLSAVAQDGKDAVMQKQKREEQPFNLFTLTNFFKPAPELPRNRPQFDNEAVVFDDAYLFSVLGFFYMHAEAVGYMCTCTQKMVYHP